MLRQASEIYPGMHPCTNSQPAVLCYAMTSHPWLHQTSHEQTVELGPQAWVGCSQSQSGEQQNEQLQDIWSCASHFKAILQLAQVYDRAHLPNAYVLLNPKLGQYR